MKKFLLSSCLVLVVIVTVAQDTRMPSVERIEALKVAYVTKELNLSAEEAQKFWPVHNSYFEELKRARKENRDNELVFEEKALAIRKKYNVDFRKILGSDERANRVYNAERGFNSMMRKELMKRRMDKSFIERAPKKSDNNR